MGARINGSAKASDRCEDVRERGGWEVVGCACGWVWWSNGMRKVLLHIIIYESSTVRKKSVNK